MKSQHINVLHAFSVPDWSEMCGVVGVLTVLLLDYITFEGFFFPMLKKTFFFQKLAGLWLVGEVVNHVGLYGSKVAEGCSAFQRRSCSSLCCVVFNPFWPSDAIWHQSTMPPLVQIMVCCLFDAKPLPQLILTLCKLDHKEQSSVEFEWKYNSLHSKICIFKCCLQNVGHFVQALNMLMFCSGL